VSGRVDEQLAYLMVLMEIAGGSRTMTARVTSTSPLRVRPETAIGGATVIGPLPLVRKMPAINSEVLIVELPAERTWVVIGDDAAGYDCPDLSALSPIVKDYSNTWSVTTSANVLRYSYTLPAGQWWCVSSMKMTMTWVSGGGSGTVLAGEFSILPWTLGMADTDYGPGSYVEINSGAFVLSPGTTIEFYTDGVAGRVVDVHWEIVATEFTWPGSYGSGDCEFVGRPNAFDYHDGLSGLGSGFSYVDELVASHHYEVPVGKRLCLQGERISFQPFLGSRSTDLALRWHVESATLGSHDIEVDFPTSDTSPYKEVVGDVFGELVAGDTIDWYRTGSQFEGHYALRAEWDGVEYDAPP
jgi:hypothetical protein